MKEPLLYSSTTALLVVVLCCFATGFLIVKSRQARPLAPTQLPYRWATFLAYLTLFSCLLIPPVEFAVSIKGKDWLYAGIVAMFTALSLVAAFGLLARRKFGVVLILFTMLIQIVQSLFTETDVQRIAEITGVTLFAVLNIVYFRKRWPFLTRVPPTSPAPPAPT